MYYCNLFSFYPPRLIFYYTFIVTNALQREEIDKLRRKLKETHNGLIEPGNPNGNDSNSQRQCSSTYVNDASSNTYSRLLYVKVSICHVYYSPFKKGNKMIFHLFLLRQLMSEKL